jgi:hypothetical protein
MMNLSFCGVYHCYSVHYDFLELVSCLKSRGVFLEQPDTGMIIRLSEEGDSIPASAKSISDVIDKTKTVAFQWWIDHSTDVCCRIRLLDSYVSQIYYLDGLSESEREIVIQALRDYFRELAKAGRAILLIVDRRKYPEDFDWDGFVLGREEITIRNVLPDEVVIKSEDLRRIKIDISNHSGAFSEGYVTVRRE